MSTKKNLDATPARRWLDYVDASAYLGISERALRRWVPQGKVPFTKFPGSSRVLFDPAKLDEFLQSCSSTPAGPQAGNER